MKNFFKLFINLLLAIFLFNNNIDQLQANETCLNLNETNEINNNNNDTVLDDKYKLFSTKTTYLNARNEIRKIFPHEWPEEIEKCQPIYLFFLNRHSIRYPSAKEIRKLRILLDTIRNELFESNRLSYRMYIHLVTWHFKMQENDDNHVSYTGKLETAQTAKIFYELFPTLLDIDNTNFDVGISSKIRTEETADAFIDSLINIQFYRKHRPQSKNEIKNKKFKKIYRDVLMSHKKCKQYLKDSTSSIPKSEKYLQLLDSNPVKKILINFSSRNGLKYTIKIDSLILLYKACSYETAIYRYSPWCYLFTKNELKIIEYLLDVDEYYDAYQIDPHRKMACSIIGDLQTKLYNVIQQPQQSPNTTLYFSHENLLSKVLSYFDLFKKFPLSNSSDNDEYFCIPEDREWRSSLIVPFGTNFAAVLYNCNNNNNSNGQNSTYKVFTLVNEIPVIVRGCDSSLCDIDQFFQEFYREKIECNLTKICKL